MYVLSTVLGARDKRMYKIPLHDLSSHNTYIIRIQSTDTEQLIRCVLYTAKEKNAPLQKHMRS